LGGDGYRHVGPLGLGNGSFNNNVVNLHVIVSTLSLGIKISIGASDDCKDCAMSGESSILLLGFLDLWRRWRGWVGFGFDLGVGVVLCWVGDLRNCWRIYYLWG
jgi:hypothetical protein